MNMCECMHDLFYLIDFMVQIIGTCTNTDVNKYKFEVGSNMNTVFLNYN